MKYTYLIGMVAGLMTSTAAFADPVTIQFWDNQHTESGLSQYQQAAVERFEKENPDIKVQVTTVPYPEYQQRLLTAVQGGNAPDVATLDQIWVAAFAKAGAIAPLDDVAAKAGVKADTFFKGAWDSANYDGHLWGIPFNVEKIDLDAQQNLQPPYRDISLTAKVPTLLHEGMYLSESSAIIEYLEEVFGAPGHPSVFPKNVTDRARARQVQAWIRSDLMPIRTERTTAVIFFEPNPVPLSEEGRVAAPVEATS